MQAPEAGNEVLLNPAQLGEWLGVTRRTVDKWRSMGIGPQALRIGPRKVLYRKSDVLAWLDTSAIPLSGNSEQSENSQRKGPAH